MVPDAAPSLLKEEEVTAIIEKPIESLVVEKPVEREPVQERPEKRQREPRESRSHREPRERKSKKEKEPAADILEEPVTDPFAEIDEEKESSSGLSEAQEKYKEMINSLSTTSKANILGKDGEVIREVSVRELVNTLKNGVEGVYSVVFDGIITQRIVDIASNMNIETIVGTKLGNIAKQPENVEIWTKDELNA